MTQHHPDTETSHPNNDPGLQTFLLLYYRSLKQPIKYYSFTFDSQVPMPSFLSFSSHAIPFGMKNRSLSYQQQST